jgi:hypothetical protein
MAKSVKGTKTETCLKDAFAGEQGQSSLFVFRKHG